VRDYQEVNENPEDHIAKPTEKQLETYDNYKASENLEQINTYDDIGKQDKRASIKTYDDLRDTEKASDKAKTADATDKTVKDTPELKEQKRIDLAAEEIKKIGWMKPEEWEALGKNIDKKRIALEHSGRALGKAYDHPAPPLATEKMDNSNLQGGYGDGPKYRPENPGADKRGFIGDYGIEMNEIGEDPNTHKKLFGEDPREAVETYGHEFRHSYQCEQAQRYEKGFKVDDLEKAKEWSENFKDYKEPPDSNVTEADSKAYEAYWNQPVENDARDFGSKLSSRIYGDNEDIERN
jgi:hypothetical protein